MAAGRVKHWKHGWIPISPEAKAYVAGRGPKPVTSASAANTASRLKTNIEKQGGFTYDPKSGRMLQIGKASGYAVAIPGTEEIVGVEKVHGEDITREDFAAGLAAAVSKHQDAIAKGAVIGGWYSPERNTYMVELSTIIPADQRDRAILEGKKRNQEAIFDLKTGESIFTGGTGDSGLVKKGDDPGIISTFVAEPTAAQKAAVKYYSGPGYVPLNTSLRFGTKAPPPVQQYMRELDAAISESTVKQDTTVYRGVQTGSWLPEGLPPGAIIEDKGYMSTAADPSGQYSGDTKMVIRVPKGAHGLHLDGYGLTHHANEKELLLPRGTKLRVVSDHRGADGKRLITAEVDVNG